MAGTEQYDVVIVGGSLGGSAAALSAGAAGVRVCLIEAKDWLGGQYTSQGVSKPDENEYIETVGSTLSYRTFRHDVRAYYRANYKLSVEGAAQPLFNPGGPYPGFALEPKLGNRILQQQLAALPNVTLRLNTTVASVQMNGSAVASVTVIDSSGDQTTCLAAYFLDATDLGDLLPLCGQRDSDWVLGAESQAETGEADAPAAARPDWIQPITIPFALERRPLGEDNTIAPPANYSELKASQEYSILDGYISTMFVAGKDMWSYRQFIDVVNFDDPAFPYDLTMINCASNDYQGGTVPNGDPTEDAAVIAAASQASLGYLYWLQTECPHDGDPATVGYPELKLRPDVFDTPDGTAPMPYIRESRRIKAVKTIVEGDIVRVSNPGPRAALFTDSCGIGLYGLDVHGFNLVQMPQLWQDTWPYQIALGALIPVRWTNLLPACKNLGVTHLTNGAYRLHPIEWNIGEAAGALAAFCVQQNTTPAAVQSTQALLVQFQHVLLAAGVPLFWWTDVTVDDPEFAAVHMLGTHGIVSGYSDMSFRSTDTLTAQDKQDIEQSAGQSFAWPGGTLTRGQAAIWVAQQLGL